MTDRMLGKLLGRHHREMVVSEQHCAACHNYSPTVAEVRAVINGISAARSAIESEIAMASDTEGTDQFEKGALAAYRFALSVLPVAPSNLGSNDG